MSDQSSRVNDQLSQVLTLDGAEFLGQAYLTVLGRPIDADGFRTYDARLRAGTSKLAIIRELHSSPEGVAFGADMSAFALAHGHETSFPNNMTLPQLLRLNGALFVDAAHVAVLGRVADAATRRRHVARLAAGAHKLQVLLDVRQSAAGRPVPSLDGLEEAVHQMRGGLYPVAANISELLEFEDQAFVDCAYKTLLRRPPDAIGLDHHLQLLRQGASKLRIVAGLALSSEGRQRKAAVPGLKRAIFHYRLARSKLTGWLLRPLMNVEGDTVIECRLRAIENRLMRNQLEHEFSQLESDQMAQDVALVLEAASRQRH